LLYVHTSVSAGRNKSFLNGQIVAGLGGQAALSLLGIAGRTDASRSATLTGPRGNTLAGTRTDSRAGFADLFPQASLKWNGVHNWMTYLTGNIPVGTYDAKRLANLGLGQGAVDGGGYTYLDPRTGREFAAVTGLTYNLHKPALDYQNGIDFHLDWVASQFLSKELFAGPVGYLFNQITGDS
jgi:hypothetical protein